MGVYCGFGDCQAGAGSLTSRARADRHQRGLAVTCCRLLAARTAAAGLACDPATGEVISCKKGDVRLPARSWRGATAKALAVEILEKDHGFK